MRAILYDCSDHPNAQYRGVTLRLVDDDGRMVLQGQVLTNDGRDLAQRIATGLGAELTFVGPPKSPVSPQVLVAKCPHGGLGDDSNCGCKDRSKFPPAIVAKAVVVHGPAEGPDAGWLF